MSRNLGTSSCCGKVVKLEDLRNKPIEFRRYKSEPVVIGTNWICPSCHTSYFALWRDAQLNSWGVVTRGFVIDLSYYDTFNDELSTEPIERPWYICLDNAEDIQDIW